MDCNELKLTAGFYENELTNRFPSFWIPQMRGRKTRYLLIASQMTEQPACKQR